MAPGDRVWITVPLSGSGAVVKQRIRCVVLAIDENADTITVSAPFGFNWTISRSQAEPA